MHRHSMSGSASVHKLQHAACLGHAHKYHVLSLCDRAAGHLYLLRRAMHERRHQHVVKTSLLQAPSRPSRQRQIYACQMHVLQDFR